MSDNQSELREQVTKIISQDGWVDIHEVNVEEQVNTIMALIEARDDETVLEMFNKDVERNQVAVMPGSSVE